MPKQIAERAHVNPDTGVLELLGIDEAGDTIAKDERTALVVVQEYMDEYGAELTRLGLLTPANIEYIQERMDILYPYPPGYTKKELADVVKRGIAIGDITKPAPVVAPPSDEEQRVAEYESWSRDRNTTAAMRAARRESEPEYRAWYTSTAYVERTGTPVTKEDVVAITTERSLVEFVDAFRRAPRDARNPKNGWIILPNFMNNAPMTVEQFNSWIEAASAARLM